MLERDFDLALRIPFECSVTRSSAMREPTIPLAARKRSQAACTTRKKVACEANSSLTGSPSKRAWLSRMSLDMIRQQGRQGRIAVVQSKQLPPEVHVARDQMRPELEDVGQDELLGRRLAEGLGGMLGMRLEQRLPVLGAESADHAVAQTRKQIRQAQADRRA